MIGVNVGMVVMFSENLGMMMEVRANAKSAASHAIDTAALGALPQLHSVDLTFRVHSSTHDLSHRYIALILELASASASKTPRFGRCHNPAILHCLR